MLLSAAFIATLLGSCVSAPAARSSTSDELLKALGTGVTSALAGTLETGLTSLSSTLVSGVLGSLTSAISGIFGKRSLVGEFGNIEHEIEAELKEKFDQLIAKILEGHKRDADDGIKDILKAIEKPLLGAVESVGVKAVLSLLGKRGLVEDIENVLKGEVEAFGKKILASESLFKEAIEGTIGDILGKLARRSVKDDLLAALAPQLAQAGAQITGAALAPLTNVLTSGVSSLVSGGLGEITKLVSGLFG